MSNWYCIKLSREQYDAEELAILRGAFQEAYVASNGPRGMALLGTWDDYRRFYLVYATPASVSHMWPLLDAYSAEIQAPSNPRALSFICGDESALSSLMC